MTGADDFIVGFGATAAGFGEPVTDFYALDGLDAHEGGRELGVEPVVAADVRPQSDGEPGNDDFHDAAQGVAGLLGCFDFGDHGCFGGLAFRRGRVRANRGGINGTKIIERGFGTIVRVRTPNRDNV